MIIMADDLWLVLLERKKDMIHLTKKEVVANQAGVEIHTDEQVD